MGQYRGIHNGGWKKGFLSYNFITSEYEIVNSQGTWPVIAESVGQNTGFTEDKTDIYQDDIFRVQYECNVGVHELIGIVDFCDSTGVWTMDFLQGAFSVPLYEILDNHDYSIIGNATDDPKLLESDHEG